MNQSSELLTRKTIKYWNKVKWGYSFVWKTKSSYNRDNRVSFLSSRSPSERRRLPFRGWVVGATLISLQTRAEPKKGWTRLLTNEILFESETLRLTVNVECQSLHTFHRSGTSLRLNRLKSRKAHSDSINPARSSKKWAWPNWRWWRWGKRDSGRKRIEEEEVSSVSDGVEGRMPLQAWTEVSPDVSPEIDRSETLRGFRNRTESATRFSVFNDSEWLEPSRYNRQRQRRCWREFSASTELTLWFWVKCQRFQK